MNNMKSLILAAILLAGVGAALYYVFQYKKAAVVTESVEAIEVVEPAAEVEGAE